MASEKKILWMDDDLGYINSISKHFEKAGYQVSKASTIEEVEHSNLDLFVAASKTTIAMVETKAKQVSDEIVFSAIKEAHVNSQGIISLIEDLVKEAGKEKLVYSTIAEEVEEVLPQLVYYYENGEPMTVLYHELPVLLLNELQKKSILLEQLMARVEQLEKQAIQKS